MKKFTTFIILLLLAIPVIYSQYSTRLFYGGYDGSSRINLMDEYDKQDCNTALGVDLFSKPSDGKLFFHRLSDNSFYNGVVVSDKDWNRLIVGVRKYTSSGNKIDNSEKLYDIGSAGYGSSNYMGPVAVAVTYYDADEICIYVVDQINDRIQRCLFNVTNGNVRGWSSLAAGQFNRPFDIEVDHKNDLSPGNDELWIADSYNSRIIRMNYSGTLLDSYGTIKTGTEGTPGNIKYPRSISLYRDLDKVYNHTIAVSDNGNNRLIVLEYDGSTFNEEYNITYANPSLITCVQFDQESANIYAVDKLNSKIYKYMYRPVLSEKIQLCGEYGGYGTGDHQLKHPMSIHPIVPLETSPGSGYFWGANNVGILEEWSNNSGFKIGYEGVDILDMNVSVPVGKHKVEYSYKIPSGIGYITETIKVGTENVVSIISNVLRQAKSRNNIWYGDEDPNISGDDYLESGTPEFIAGTPKLEFK